MEPVEVMQAADPADVLSNMIKFYRDGGRFCDVKIQLGDEVFELQRSFLAAISAYFDGMFRGNFEEGHRNYVEPIVLHDVDASAFKEIMDSFVTGTLNIDENNVYPLIRAADFLQIRGGLIERRCYSNIKEEGYQAPLPRMFDILSFACLTEKQDLIDIMCDHIVDHLEHFVKDARIMEIPLEVLNGIQLKFKERLIYNEFDHRGNLLFCLIICWVNHSRATRQHHRQDLMKNINSSCISLDFALSLLNEHEIHIDEATNRGDNIEWLSYAYDPTIMSGIDFATGTTCELVACKISELTERESRFKIRDLEWVLTVSHSSATPEYLSFHAHYEGDRDVCDAKVSFIILSQKDGVKDLIKNVSRSFYGKTKAGFAQFLRWSDFINEEKGYVTADAVTFQICVSF